MFISSLPSGGGCSTQRREREREREREKASSDGVNHVQGSLPIHYLLPQPLRLPPPPVRRRVAAPPPVPPLAAHRQPAPLLLRLRRPRPPRPEPRLGPAPVSSAGGPRREVPLAVRFELRCSSRRLRRTRRFRRRRWRRRRWGGGGGGGVGGEDGRAKSVVDGAGEASAVSSDVIILDVGGMTCGGCAASVKRILENQPQVSAASVNLTTETAVVWPVSEAKAVPNWQKELGETLAKHLTNCGFKSNPRGQEATEGDVVP
ncbi:hypothetical protein NL676_039389 [Syzygium grande]|nr:hypothetical protein NL676_039389 [Syzygium grande]